MMTRTLLDDVRNERWDAVGAGVALLEDPEDQAWLLAELCFHGQTSLVKALLDRGANPNVRYPGAVASLLAFDLEPGTTAVGQTILGAAWRGHATLPTLEVLLAAGADPDGHTFSGYTPVQLAVALDRREWAAMLLRCGADPYRPSTDLDRPTAFDIAEGVAWAEALLREWVKRPATRRVRNTQEQ